MPTTQRLEGTPETATRTRARGHLSLVEWDVEAEAAKPPASVRVHLPRRTTVDRLYGWGVLLLMAAVACAALASLTRL